MNRTKQLQYDLAINAAHNTEGIMLFPEQFNQASILLDIDTSNTVTKAEFAVSKANSVVLTGELVIGHN